METRELWKTKPAVFVSKFNQECQVLSLLISSKALRLPEDNPGDLLNAESLNITFVLV
jgi:hypothetical protein